MKQKRKKKRNPNKELMLITSMFSIVFFLMAGYLAWFIAFESESVINSPYNHRQDGFVKKVVRGSILASDGSVLAKTEVNQQGEQERIYPYGELFSHVVGYDTHGKSGIESFMNFNLLRSNTSLMTKIQNEISGEKSMGDTVISTLDISMQQAAFDALGSHDGAIVIMDAETGAVRAMVSKPDFDPGMIDEKWDLYNEEGSSVLLNRVTAGLYPPGSTFKIITALEYIRENQVYDLYSYDCTGSFARDDFVINCHNHEVHGNINLEQSFAHSCNTSFTNIGMLLDIDRFCKTVDSLFFNQSIPSQFPVKESSFELEASDKEFMKAQTVIGQGTTLVTPLQMTAISAAIANKGTMMKPYLVEKVVSVEGAVVSDTKPEAIGAVISEREAGILESFMKAVTEYGTASSLGSYGVNIYGKTGTAQFGSDTNNHFWFTGYYKSNNHTYAISVVVEDEEASSNQAVRVMRNYLESFSD